MVSADFFKKKKISKLCLISFILSVLAGLTWLITCVWFYIWPHYYVGWAMIWLGIGMIVGIPSIILSIKGCKTIDKTKQSGYKLALAALYIVGVTLIIMVFFTIGIDRGYGYGYFYGPSRGYGYW